VVVVAANKRAGFKTKARIRKQNAALRRDLSIPRRDRGWLNMAGAPLSIRDL
jgi:hypothetical protein